jgi:predicted ribosome quality control (RQC) complex YloA/Tae2 family protein
MEELQTRLDATERRLQEENEILQAQIADCKRAEETFEKAQKYTEEIQRRKEIESLRGKIIIEF